ncbi:MAG: hypothetical protein KDH97_13965 [Calditrichaeota bacterium]|nr:hypothetical protein [Calditrichota bacterium]MCB0314812.1 hypothetical protein [Calditrichota bacterium]
MKNEKLRTLLLIFIVALVTILLYRLFFPGEDTHAIKKEIERREQRIDSLQTVIQQRNDSLAVIHTRVAEYEKNIGDLKTKIDEKDQQITYYQSRKGRFNYGASSDSLLHELNIIAKQRLGK